MSWWTTQHCQLLFTFHKRIHKLVQYLLALLTFETCVKNLLNVYWYVTTTMICHAISSQKVKIPCALK